MENKLLEITIPGSVRTKKTGQQPVPIPANGETKIKMYDRHGVLMSVRIIIQPGKAYRKWEKESRVIVLKYLRTNNIYNPIDGPLDVKVTARYKGARPDLSGVLESIGDCLQGYVWYDDRQIESWDGSRVIHDIANPKTIVEVFRHDWKLT